MKRIFKIGQHGITLLYVQGVKFPEEKAFAFIPFDSNAWMIEPNGDISVTPYGVGSRSFYLTNKPKSEVFFGDTEKLIQLLTDRYS